MTATDATLIFRRLLDPPLEAAANMARDEWLLDLGVPTVRRTAWCRPSVTIGRFQAYRLFSHPSAPGSRPVDPVRRITGGGAIFHGDDLTLAIVAPTPTALFPDRAPLAIARRAATAVGRAVAPDDRVVELRGGEWDEREQRSIDDCFERRSPFDLVLRRENAEDLKVGGFALARRAGNVLIQASLPRTPLGLDPSDDDAALRAIVRALGDPTGGLAWIPSTEEQLAVDSLIERRYGNSAWSSRIRSRRSD